MATSLMTRKPAREAGYEMGQYIAARIQPSALGTDPVTVEIGTLPAGCIVTAVHSKVVTAITGGTPVLTVGSFGDTGLNNLVATMAEAAGSELLQPTVDITFPLAADTRIFASISGAATAGDAYICVAFYKPIA